MIGPAELSSWRHDLDFREHPAPLLVLDRDLTIRAVNRSHEQVMGFSEARLLGQHVFDAYPANPATGDGDDGRRCMADSFERVLRERRAHHLVLQRYDIPDPSAAGTFVPRTWLPVNAPVWSGGEVVGVLVRAEEARVPEEVDQRFRRFRDLLREGQGDDALVGAVVDAVVWALRAWGESRREVEQLREALTSRATIEQAKGILMARGALDPAAAFSELVRLSNSSNVRLVDVAHALVYQAARG